MSSPVMVSQWFKLDEAQEERARKLHAKALIIDCLGGHLVSPEPPPVDGKSYLDRLVESGVRGVNVTLAAHADDFDDALWEMYHYFNLITARPDKTLHVERAEDLERAHREGKVGIIFGFQAATPIGTHIE